MITLTMAQVQELYGSLISVSNGSETVVNEDGKDRVVQTPYKNLSGKTLLAIARNLDTLKGPAGTFQDTIRNMQREVQNGSNGSVNNAQVAVFEKEIVEMLQQEGEYPLVCMSDNDLHLDENTINPVVLVGLLPILRYETA